ncbi:MAG TPA: helix-turn-helix transcriptional regulator [Labilithrix sp.]|nr:helix-turn-helix transcriptional regulator [Labilithrix sp.]
MVHPRDFDSDGRSYVIAIENEDDISATRALTRRERQVLELASHGHGDDLIAYTIGISEATAQTHLQRALAKTNIKSRAALVRAAATLHARLERDRTDDGGSV